LRATTKKGHKLFWGKSAPLQTNAYAPSFTHPTILASMLRHSASDTFPKLQAWPMILCEEYWFEKM